MASNDFIKELAKKPPKVKFAILMGIIIGFGAVYYQLVYSGMVEERDGLRSRKASLVKKQDQLNTDLADMKRLAEKNEELQRIIRDNQKALPVDAELPALYDHLQRKAGDAGVNIRKWENLAEQPLDVYIRVPVRVEVTGTFYNLMRYFSLLGPRPKDATRDAAASDPQNPEKERIRERIVSIENLSLTSPKLEDGQIQLTANFVVVTFRQPEDEKKKKEKAAKEKAAKEKAAKEAAAKEAAAKKGAAGKVKKAADDRKNAIDKKAATGTKKGGGGAGTTK